MVAVHTIKAHSSGIIKYPNRKQNYATIWYLADLNIHFSFVVASNPIKFL